MIAKSRALARRDRPAAITPQMELAIDRLMAGDTVIAAAAAAGVDRTTIHRWRREHWGFQAELNRRRRDLHEQLYHRLVGLAERAVDNVANAVNHGDLKASRWLLDRLARTIEFPGPESENPEYLRLMADKVDADMRECELLNEFKLFGDSPILGNEREREEE